MSAPVVGVIGGGQLARMLAEAASPLGIAVRVLAAPTDEGASEVIPDLVVGSPTDPDALTGFARGVDVVTFDHENVDHETLLRLESEGVAIRPGVGTLRFADKAHQRRRFRDAGLPVPPFLVIDGESVLDRSDQPGADLGALAAVEAFADRHDGQVVAKASRGGYDGRGVWMLERREIAPFLDSYEGAPLVVEPRLDLDSEVAVLVARRPSGQTATWPPFETIQVDGMCDEVVLPARLDAPTAATAAGVAVSVAEVVGAIGVMAIELFVVGGELIVNEIAPRVHNSGHLTIEGCATSQFEQHLRAVLDWPLGPTHATTPVAVMVNVVGEPGHDPRWRQAEALERVPEAHLHLYGKTARAGRKIGHVTVLGDDRGTTRTSARIAADVLAGVAIPQSPEPPGANHGMGG